MHYRMSFGHPTAALSFSAAALPPTRPSRARSSALVCQPPEPAEADPQAGPWGWLVPLVTTLPRAACALAIAPDMTLSAAGSRPDSVCAATRSTRAARQVRFAAFG